MSYFVWEHKGDGRDSIDAEASYRWAWKGCREEIVLCI